MTLSEAISTHAETDSGIDAIAHGRIYPQSLPQSPTLPALVYRRIMGSHRTTHDGPNGTCEVRYQFEAWAATYSAAERLRNAVRDAFHGFSGVLGGTSPVGVTVLATYFPTDVDRWDTVTRKHYLILDLYFDYRTDTES